MSIRIDPILSNGIFDRERYELLEYDEIKSAVLHYLISEGFDEKPDEYKVEILGNLWYVKVT